MKRVYFLFSNGESNNLPGDYIEMRDEFIIVYNGDYIVAIVRRDTVNRVCISEKKEA